MKNIIKLSIIATLSTYSGLNASEVIIDGYRGGHIDLQFKAMTIINDLENGFTPNNGTAYLVKLKYETNEIYEGLKVGAGMYINGDAGLTDWEKGISPNYNKGAFGMVVDTDGDEKGLMGELYLDYTHEYFHSRLGRQRIKSPLTVTKTSLMPNFYQAYMFDTKDMNGFKITAGHINGMSFGSRAMADMGIIGERTGTAGVAFGGRGAPRFVQDGGNIEQADFMNIGVAAGLGESTNGRSVLGITYKGIKNLQVDLWAYHSFDIATDFYSEIKYTIPVMEGMKVRLSGQYLAQRDTGRALAGARDFNLAGAKVAVGTKKWGAFLAYNKSGDQNNERGNTEGQYFNAWGADPAYTSSIFSRNAYREDVEAYKVSAHYKIMKGLKLVMNYAHYGQSATSAGNSPHPSRVSQNDAYEIDTVVIYKPNKKWMFKVFNAKRLSEYDGIVFERRQDQYRVIGSYTF